MARKKTPRVQGRDVELPPWWFDEAQRRTKGKSHQQIAEDLFRAVGKTWDRTVVGDFVRGDRATIEMAAAFCRTYELPQFEWVARSPLEADAFRRTARDYDALAPDANALAAYDSAAEQLEKQHESQTALVKSADEVGTGRGRRTRRMGPGRT